MQCKFHRNTCRFFTLQTGLHNDTSKHIMTIHAINKTISNICEKQNTVSLHATGCKRMSLLRKVYISQNSILSENTHFPIIINVQQTIGGTINLPF